MADTFETGKIVDLAISAAYESHWYYLPGIGRKSLSLQIKVDNTNLVGTIVLNATNALPGESRTGVAVPLVNRLTGVKLAAIPIASAIDIDDIFALADATEAAYQIEITFTSGAGTLSVYSKVAVNGSDNG